MLKLYENIKKLRIKNDMSQDDLAQKVGYKDRTSIAKIEAGNVDLSQSKIVAFASALGVSPAYLMGWDDSTMSHRVVPEIEEIIKDTEKGYIVWDSLSGTYKSKTGQMVIERFKWYVGLSEDKKYQLQNIRHGGSRLRLQVVERKFYDEERQNEIPQNPKGIDDFFYDHEVKNLLDDLRQAIIAQIDSHRPLSPADKVFEGLSESQSKELENYADFIRFRDEIGIEEIKKMMAEKDKPEE